MEDIKTIKQKTFELKQYASAILADLEKMIDEERKSYETSISDIADTKAEKIRQLNERISEKESEIVELRKKNSQLMIIF